MGRKLLHSEFRHVLEVVGYASEHLPVLQCPPLFANNDDSMLSPYNTKDVIAGSYGWTLTAIYVLELFEPRTLLFISQWTVFELATVCHSLSKVDTDTNFTLASGLSLCRRNFESYSVTLSIFVEQQYIKVIESAKT